MGKTFKILSIDGGGIKGLYSAQVLAKMEEKYNCILSDKFDLICGTSTGAILALAVSLKIPMSKAVDFYKQKGPEIFDQKRKRIPLYSKYLAIKQALISAKYGARTLEKALTDVFGTKTLRDCHNMICIPAININNASCCIFKRDFGMNSRDNNKKCVDVALASAAAPTYFPIKELDDHQYADGGLYANNPTLVGLVEFIYKILPQYQEENFDSVDILSISSCEKSPGQKHGRKNKSFWNWKSTLFDAYSQGQANFESFLLDQIIPHLKFKVNLYRVKNEPLAPQISDMIELDNASSSALTELISIGKRTADNENIKPKVAHFFETNKTISF